MERGLHLPATTIVDLVEQRLAAAEASAAREHLASCERCAEELRAVAELVNLMRSDSGEDAPPDVIRRAIRLFPGRVARAAARPSTLRRVIAAMTFDSARLQPQLGIRAGAPSIRQILYSAGELDLDLRLHSAGAQWIVAGQLLGPCREGEVELRGTEHRRARLNPRCEFSLPPVAPGSYALVLHLPDVAVEVSSLTIGSEHGPG